MKKIAIMILCFNIMCMNVVTTFALTKQNDIEYQKIIQQLETMPELYSGVYIENDILHIIPFNTEKSIKTVTDIKQNANVDIVIDEAKVYSSEELNIAFEILRENRESLDITAYSIDTINNGLKVMAKQWTDEKKKNIMEITNIKNIQYITDLGSRDTILEKQVHFENNQPYHIVQYTVNKQMSYHFKREELYIIADYIKNNIDEKFDRNQYAARLVKKQQNTIILSFKDKQKEQITTQGYYIFIENEEVIHIYAVTEVV
ncbi:hypothetical protein [Clostridium sp. MD294]|uniref:hypothetical protein n=1 Tax=Clostridium sp. MD294 TaxID=97138 RepID=UPI0002CAE43D|nr:hypothetical protein [Clostridium sp. MD294]NDO46328.1 hypothetical protein [Clostridium sp. MD294]USF29245.1 hypothetical protein C820_000630 [Clostridium sp. MD294]